MRSASYGLVLYRREIALGNKVALVLTPKWCLHYYAHLDSLDAYPGQSVLAGSRLGVVGATGNTHGKPAHLHYTIITLLPYPWSADASTQGQEEMFCLDPNTVLSSRRGVIDGDHRIGFDSHTFPSKRDLSDLET